MNGFLFFFIFEDIFWVEGVGGEVLIGDIDIESSWLFEMYFNFFRLGKLFFRELK